jgi:hypothetical protein
MHYEKVEERKSQYTKCPICSEERKELLANHDNLIQYLTKVHTKEQTLIAEQLQAGISNDRILENARKIRDNQLDRLNLITRGDLRNWIRRFNIDKKRDADDMVATVLKVEEWNKEGKNQGFLFKKILNTEEEKNSEEDLCIEEPSTSKINYIHQYLDEASKNKGNELISSERRKEVR